MTDEYIWTDNPTVSGIATCDTDVLNDCLMHLKYNGSSSRNIGEIVPSTIPLTDAGLHLLDGALLASGSYADFVDYIGDLYDSGDYMAIFDTEANWQAAVTLSGVCDKFVYDSVNNTVRLPKYGNQTFTKSPTIASTVPVKGNGVGAGWTDGTDTWGWVSAGAQGSCPNNLTTAYGKNVGTTDSGTNRISNTKVFGLTTDGTKSGMVADLSSITNYPLNCYYYIVIATTTKTSIQVDIDEIATDLNGKADVDLLNINASCKPIDGQWQSLNITIASAVSSPTTENLQYDLSSYLPVDNYLYEILLVAGGTTGSTSGNIVQIGVKSSIIGVTQICTARTRTSSTVSSSGNLIIPVGLDRTIEVDKYSGNTGTFNLFLLGYRRVGTNV